MFVDLGEGDNSFSSNNISNSTAEVHSGSGVDSISIGAGNGNITVTTGDGADNLTLRGSLTGSVDAGSGNDTVHIGVGGSLTITLGTGSNSLVLDSWNGTSATTITDFAGGSGGDTLDYNALLTSQLIGWDGSSNPFRLRLSRLVQDGADILFQIDKDGGSSTFDYATLNSFSEHRHQRLHHQQFQSSISCRRKRYCRAKPERKRINQRYHR